MIKKIIALGFVIIFSGVSLFAMEVEMTLPSISGSYDSGIPAVKKLFEEDAVAALSRFDGMNKLVTAMSNATSYAADGATTRNFMGYKMFAVAIGTMGALQTGSFDIEDKMNKIEESQDLDFGVNAQAITVSVGANLGFLVEGLYVTGKVGSFSFNIQDFDINMFSCGLLAQYQLIDPIKTLFVTWKGLQVGTGLIYYNSKISFTTSAASISTPVSVNGSSASLVYDPDLDSKFETKGIKIPIDVMTGVRLAVVDFSFGLGCDINVWSNSDLTYKADGETRLEGLAITTTPGRAKVSGGTTGKSADAFKFKTMTGIGLSLGPVKLDVPITYYFGEGHGANVGVTAGIAF